MDKIDEKFHNRRCLVWTYDYAEPFRGIVSVARPSGTMIGLHDGESERTIRAISIKDIHLDEPDEE